MEPKVPQVDSKVAWAEPEVPRVEYSFPLCHMQLAEDPKGGGDDRRWIGRASRVHGPNPLGLLMARP